MALINYTFTSLLNADSGGQNTVASEAVEVRFQFDATLATIYSDSAGASPIAQPGAVTDANGILSFWALPGYYTITAASRTENVVIDDGSRLNPLVLSDAQANIKNLKLNETFEVVERTSGNGGGAKWKAIDATTSPGNAPNGRDIVSGNAAISFGILDQVSVTHKTLALAQADLNLKAGDKVIWQGYHAQSDGGSGWGVVKAGVHTDDGGSTLTITANLYIEQNLKGKSVSIAKFGTKGDGTTDDTAATQACLTYCATNRRKAFAPAPSSVYYITSTLLFSNIDFEGEVSIAFEASTNSLFKTDQDINMFLIYATRFNTITNLTGQFTQANPTSAAIGFTYAENFGSGNNVRLGTFKNLIIQRAYTGHITAFSGATIAVATWKNCASRLTQGGWGFEFAAAGGSTNCTLINCFAESDPAVATRKGMKFTNIKDINLIGCSIDFALNDGLVITNTDTYNVIGLNFESPQLTINNQSLVTITNAQGFISNIGIQGLVVNPGAGNDCAIVAPPNAGGLNIGHIHQLGTTVTSGALYKYRIGAIEVGGLNISDHDVIYSDIEYNGFDSRVNLNGKKSVTGLGSANGTWVIGETLWKRNPVEAGAVAGKYIITSWSRVTAGSGHILNTDWFENRSLTGN